MVFLSKGEITQTAPLNQKESPASKNLCVKWNPTNPNASAYSDHYLHTLISTDAFFIFHHLYDGGMNDENTLFNFKDPSWLIQSLTETKWGEFTFQANPSLNTCMA